MLRFMLHHWMLTIFLLFVVAASLFSTVSYGQLQRTPPKLAFTAEPPPAWTGVDAPLTLPWPSKGSAAVTVSGVGQLAASKSDTPRALASLVKVMTAYVVLKDHPLHPGEAGPLVDVTADDVRNYQQGMRNGESVVTVREGTQLTEMDLLSGLLIPSANNYANILANWSSTGYADFIARMNAEAAALGMTNTRYTDASGISPASRSTAQDQLKLAAAAMADPVFEGIVGQKQVTLPVAGTQYNVNSSLGINNIVGVKTGWTEDAGACFVFAANRAVGANNVQVIGVVMGQDVLGDAFSTSNGLINAVGASLQPNVIVPGNQPWGAITARWGGTTEVMPAREVSILTWPGIKVETKVEMAPLADSVKAGDVVGRILIKAPGQDQEVPLVAQGDIAGPTIKWRLQRLQ